MNDKPDRADRARKPPVGISGELRPGAANRSATAENLLFADSGDDPADLVEMVRHLTKSVNRLERSVAESREAVAREAERMRQAFATLIDLMEQQDTERRVAESDWKRQEAERLRAILTAEIESHGKKRRWFGFGG